MYESTGVWAHMHTQKDLVSNSTQVWARGERKASLGSWVNRLFFFPSREHCFAVTFWQYWTDTTSSDQTDVFYAAITHGHRRLGFPATGWVTWLKHRAVSEAEGMSWSPDQKLSQSDLCSALPASDLHGNEGRCGKLDSLQKIHYHCWF